MTGIMQTNSYFFLRENAAKWCTAIACTGTNMAASLAVLDRSDIDGSTDEPTSSMGEEENDDCGMPCEFPSFKKTVVQARGRGYLSFT